MPPDPYGWSADLDVLVLVPTLVVAYAAATRLYPAPRWRVVAFGGALLLILASHVTPLASLSNHYLLSAHLLQNVALAEWAPALFLLGLPPALAARIAALPGARALTNPFVALPLWLGTYFVWHLPWAYEAALRHPGTLLHLEHASYFITGCLFWWAVVHQQPHGLGYAAKAAYVFGAFVLAAPLGLLLSLLPEPIYGFYAGAPQRVWGLSPIADQQIAGVTMAVEQSILFFAVCATQFSRFLREQDAVGAYKRA